MPLYEYQCSKCHDEFELLVRSGEAPACPSCGTKSVVQQLSVVAAHSAGKSELPVCGPVSPSGCGLPQCGAGRCGMQYE